MKVKCCSWDVVFDRMVIASKEGKTLRAILVFDSLSSKWPHGSNYSLAGRSYLINSSSKYFDSSKCGNSLYATCLDPADSDSRGIRLDLYLGRWVIEGCYLLED